MSPSMITSSRSCLVTGCAGNVGSKLTRALLDLGHTVVGVDNFFSGLPDNLATFRDHPNFFFAERSITEPGLLASLGAGASLFQYIFHLAAVISVPWSMEHPEETLAVNFESTRALHQEARESGARAFVFAGSAAEYGRPVEGPVREDQAGDPQSPYGLSKLLASQYIEASGFGCSLRFFNLYGPARGKPGPYDGVVRRFLALALAGSPLTIHGQGGQTRDFVFVQDALSAILTASGLTNGGKGLCGVYNVGTGRSTSVLNLAELTIALSGGGSELKMLPRRAGDIEHSLADPSKLLRATGFRPDTPLEKGLAQTLDWFQRHHSELT